jgi:UDP-N-acetylmuramate--alanine ligase
VLCLDDANLQSLIPELERRVITYGFSAQADIYARDPKFEEFTSTSVIYHKNKRVGTLKLRVPGIHSIYNAMAAVAVGLDLNIPAKAIFQALEEYSGIGRRFELKTTVNDIMIIEDYAHHPTEISATLEAAKKGWSRRIIAVFQPHRYSRLSLLMKDFAMSFNQADVLILADIYAAGEKPIRGVSGEALYEEIQQYGHKCIHFEPDLQKIPELVSDLAEPQDIIIVMGAGSIYKSIPEIIAKLGGS